MRKKHKKSIKAFCISTFLAGIVFSGSVFGAELNMQVTKDYEQWNQLVANEKQKTLMPRSYSVEIPDSVLKDASEKKVPSLVNELVGNFKMKNKKDSLQKLGSTHLEDYYHMGDRLTLRVEHQGTTQQCWAFSVIKSLETNVAFKNNVTELPDFSERHMDYATSKTFLDGINEKGFEREVGGGGLPETALAYLNNGQGAVLESEMPFEDNENKITLDSINKEVDTTVTEYIALPSIYKEYTKDENGNTLSVTYMDAMQNTYTTEEVESIRNLIKKHIVENGAIPTITAANHAKYYNNSDNIGKATAYNCNDTNISRDHGITIVGWDDNYSRDNFAEGAKPSTDGAYIVLNSYGENVFDDGYLYVSYEDYFIESSIYSIKDSEKKDYTTIYQADFYGGIHSLGTTSVDTGYYANVYKRDKTKTEFVKNVGITVFDYVDVEIYINPDNDSMEQSSLIKIGENEELLEPGYHRLEVEPTQLTGEKFAIVVKQKSANGIFYFAVESPIENSAYARVDSDNNSYYSIDGEKWEKLTELEIPGYDMAKTDVCIKTFVTDELSEEPGLDEITIHSEKYLIQENEIYKIISGTSVTDLKSNFETNSELKIFDENVEVTESDQVVKTGMKLKLDNGEEYVLIVRGDINCDGRVTLTDLSKQILHYNETEGYILSGKQYGAADMNYDGKVSLVDVSQMLVFYNSI